jgi:hypothetical protein
MGSHWHGVIPVDQQYGFSPDQTATFRTLFKRFYPGVPIDDWLGTNAVFVPWHPIRPAPMLASMSDARDSRLTFRTSMATKIQLESSGAIVSTSHGNVRAQRVWIAAGAIHTPALLAASFGPSVRNEQISDHVLCYVGQVDNQAPPTPHWTRGGIFFPVIPDPLNTALYTIRPARFSFRHLDFGIEQRAAFGLPTGGAISKIARSMSLGLLAEAIYNRFGMFSKAARYSIYAQTPVAGAYVLTDGPTPLVAQTKTISAACNAARENQPFSGATLSQKPDLYIPGIHLHHSLNLTTIKSIGINRRDHALQVVDASALEQIGVTHHSFKMLCAAYYRAVNSV